MKKLTAIFFLLTLAWLIILSFPSLSFAICRPPGYDPSTDLDIVLDLLGWTDTGGNLGPVPFDHDLDPFRPMLSTLFEDCEEMLNSITSVGMINGTNRPADAPADYANYVCFSTPSGSTVLVPDSGYDMGGGCEAVVLYATNNSIVLKYTPDDNIASGYTIYIDNFNVSPELLAAYNEYHNSGRGEMPCFSGGETIGVSTGETCVAIRDTGTFMDPRWLEWWGECGDALALLLKLINLCILPPWEQVPSLECDPTAGGDRDSRPFGEEDYPECDTCNLTRRLTPSCATGTNIYDYAWYQRKDEDKWCPDKYDYPLIERPWSGIVRVDPSDTIIPFVGKEEDESGEKYLADYLDGTNEYFKNFPLYWLEGVNNDGAWRKLTPMAYQDELKKEMVKRAIASKAGRIQEGKIHDYNVEYLGRLCWNGPFWVEVLTNVVAPQLGLSGLKLWKLADRCIYATNAINWGLALALENPLKTAGFATRLSPLSLYKAQLTDFTDNRLPPSPLEENYRELWDEWKKLGAGFWSRLWTVIPMFSRENTPGWITPYLGQQDKDLFYTADPDAFIEKVPHVARLYEVSQALQNMLFPFYRRSWQTTPPATAQDPNNTLKVALDDSFRVGGKTSSKVKAASWTKDTPGVGECPLPDVERKEKTEIVGIQPQIALAASDSQTEKMTIVSFSSEVENLEGQVLGKKTYLAQVPTPTPTPEPEPFSGGDGILMGMHPNVTYYEQADGSIEVHIVVLYVDRGFLPDYLPHFWVRNNPPTGVENRPYQPWGNGWVLEPGWNNTPFTLAPGDCRTLTWGYQSGDQYHEKDFYGETAWITCTYCFKDGELTSTCGGPVGPPGEDVQCPLWTSNPVDPCNRVGIDGPDGDTLCCDPIEMNLRGVDKFENKDYCECGVCDGTYCGEPPESEWGCMECSENRWEECLDPPACTQTSSHCDIVKGKEHCYDCGEPYHPASRQVGVALVHPYLEEIWEQTSKFETNGIFNFFRPDKIPPFEDTDAKDELGYGYTDTSQAPKYSDGKDCPQDDKYDGSNSPGDGEFFYPHLGGVQLAKEWLTGMLVPQKSSLLELIF